MSVTVDGAKTFQSLEVPSSDIDNGLYTVQPTVECEALEGTDDQILYRGWFNTPVCPDMLPLANRSDSFSVGTRQGNDPKTA
jgi:hypothetical protein